MSRNLEIDDSDAKSREVNLGLVNQWLSGRESQAKSAPAGGTGDEGGVPNQFASHGPGDELVRNLYQLTRNVARFDSMIRNQRHLLLRRVADPDAIDDRLIRRQSRRISSEAAEIVTQADGALEELRRLSRAGDLGSFDALERQLEGARSIGLEADRLAALPPKAMLETSSTQGS